MNKYKRKLWHNIQSIQLRRKYITYTTKTFTQYNWQCQKKPYWQFKKTPLHILHQKHTGRLKINTQHKLCFIHVSKKKNITLEGKYIYIYMVWQKNVLTILGAQNSTYILYQSSEYLPFPFIQKLLIAKNVFIYYTKLKSNNWFYHKLHMCAHTHTHITMFCLFTNNILVFKLSIHYTA